jgi:hypothetical protein
MKQAITAYRPSFDAPPVAYFDHCCPTDKCNPGDREQGGVSC